MGLLHISSKGWLRDYQQKRRDEAAHLLQQKKERRERYEAYMKEEQEKRIKARIRNPKCGADFVLRHNAEADQDGKCGRMGCCVCDCAALRLVRGELQPKKPPSHPHCAVVIPPRPTTVVESTHGGSSSSSNSGSSVGGVVAIVPPSGQKQAFVGAPEDKPSINTYTPTGVAGKNDDKTITAPNTSFTESCRSSSSSSSSSSISSPVQLISSAAAAGAVYVCGSTGSLLSVRSPTSPTRQPGHPLAPATVAVVESTMPPGSIASQGTAHSAPAAALPQLAGGPLAAQSSNTSLAPKSSTAAGPAQPDTLPTTGGVPTAATTAGSIGSMVGRASPHAQENAGAAAQGPLQYVLKLQPCLTLSGSPSGPAAASAAAVAAAGAEGEIAVEPQRQLLKARCSVSAPSGCLPAGLEGRASWQSAPEGSGSKARVSSGSAGAAAAAAGAALEKGLLNQVPAMIAPQLQQRQQEREKELEREEVVIEVLPGLTTRTPTGPQAELDEGDLMVGRESGTPPYSSISRARAMWRVDEWSTGLVSMMIADGVLPPYPRPGSKASWRRLIQAAAAPGALLKQLLARKVV